jgi:hypothetical protein
MWRKAATQSRVEPSRASDVIVLHKSLSVNSEEANPHFDGTVGGSDTYTTAVDIMVGHSTGARVFVSKFGNRLVADLRHPGIDYCDAELLDFQRLPFIWVAPQRDGLLRAVCHAYPAPHTRGSIDLSESVIHRNCRKLVKAGALAAAGAQPFVHHPHIPRRRDHGRPTPLRLHRPTAARAAVADGVETTEHRIFVVGGTIAQICSL